MWEQALILKSGIWKIKTSIQFPLLCVHDAKPVTAFDSHTLKHCFGQTAAMLHFQTVSQLCLFLLI